MRLFFSKTLKVLSVTLGIVVAVYYFGAVAIVKVDPKTGEHTDAYDRPIDSRGGMQLLFKHRAFDRAMGFAVLGCAIGLWKCADRICPESVQKTDIPERWLRKLNERKRKIAKSAKP